MFKFKKQQKETGSAGRQTVIMNNMMQDWLKEMDNLMDNYEAICKEELKENEYISDELKSFVDSIIEVSREGLDLARHEAAYRCWMDSYLITIQDRLDEVLKKLDER